MDQLTQYIDKFKESLPELFENVLTSYQEKINGDFVDEYDIPEHEYVQSHPLVQLNEKLFEIKDYHLRYNFTFNNTVFFKNKIQCGLLDIKTQNLTFIDIYTDHKVYYKFDKLLPIKEYIIAFIIDYKDILYKQLNCNYNKYYYRIISVIYITNYGRFVKVDRKTNIKEEYYNGSYKLTDAINKEDEYIFINNKKLYLQEYHDQPSTYKKDKSGYPKLLTDPEINLVPLTYKFPKLFLDVINAFRNESTDDMQKCCEKYNVLLQKANSTNKYDKTIQSLEEENAKLKSKIELLKLQMEEQRKHFMG